METIKLLLYFLALFVLFCATVLWNLPKILRACGDGLLYVASTIEPPWNRIRPILYEETRDMLFLTANGLHKLSIMGGELALSHVQDKLNKLTSNVANLAIEGPNDTEEVDLSYWLRYIALVCAIKLLLDCMWPVADGNKQDD